MRVCCLLTVTTISLPISSIITVAPLTSLNRLRAYLSQKRIKYAIVGAGRISQKHGIAINKNDNSELRGVFDINKLRKSRFAQKYDAIPYKSLNDLLNDKTIDVVNICTPHDTHIEIAEKAVSNNKKVLCEKPFALSSKSLIKTLRNKKIRDNVFIVFQNNFNPSVELLYKLVKDHRTEVESQQPELVLDGEIMDFIEAELIRSQTNTI